LAGLSQAQEEERGSLSDKAQPAFMRSRKKQPKRFHKKRVALAAAPKPAGGDKGIASDDKGIADETAAAAKYPGALATKPASAAGDISWHLPRLGGLLRKPHGFYTLFGFAPLACLASMECMDPNGWPPGCHADPSILHSSSL
jgi:hypothetical protein